MNAPQPLFIGHETGDCQNVHPDVVHVQRGFCGFEYWMTFTPYPFGNDGLENPMIRVSRDGYSWTRFPGMADPLVPPPKDPTFHHADPELIFDDNAMHLVFMTARKGTGETAFLITHSRNGHEWSEPEVFQRGKWEACPSFVVDRSAWHMWAVEFDTSKNVGMSKVSYRRGRNVFELGPKVTCDMPVPGHVPWHLDIQKSTPGFEALVAAFPLGTDSSRTRLFHMQSEDGLSFRLSSSRPLLAPSLFGWDNRMIYRSCFLKNLAGNYRIWYSAASWRWRFGIGYLEGPLSNLSASVRCPSAKIPLFSEVVPSLLMRTRYHVKRALRD